MLGELVDAEWQYIFDCEAGEGWVGDWVVAGEVGWAGAECGEVVFGGEYAF